MRNRLKIKYMSHWARVCEVGSQGQRQEKHSGSVWAAGPENPGAAEVKGLELTAASHESLGRRVKD